MVIIVAIIVAAVLAFRHQAYGGVQGDRPQGSFGYIVLTWVGAASLFLLASRAGPVMLAVFAFLLSPVLIPGVYAKIFSYFGLYKQSFYFAKRSYYIFYKDTFGAALMCAVQALMHVKDDEQKFEGLGWLKSKLQEKKGKIYSGEMVMSVIIDCHINRPRDFEYMAHQLNLFYSIGKESIPGCVRRYAFKLYVVPALRESNWKGLSEAFHRWNPLRDMVTDYLWTFHTGLTAKYNFISALRFYVYKHFLIRSEFLKTIDTRLDAQEGEQHAGASDEDHVLTALLTQPNAKLDRELLEPVLLSEKRKEAFLARCQVLGVRQPQDAWGQYEESVLRSCDSAADLNNDSRVEELDRSYQNLVYLMKSIERRLLTKKLGSGQQNFRDWWRVRELFSELSADENLQNAAFMNFHAVLWNWIAELWNKEKQHCLVYFMSLVCAPLARRNHCEEFSGMLNSLISGQCS